MRSEPLTEDQKALVVANVKYAEILAMRRRTFWTSLEDRTQDAYLGLIDAARSFDPEKGCTFKTHAGRRIIGAMIDAEREAGVGPVVKISRRARENGEAEIKVVQIQAMDVPDQRGNRTLFASDLVFVDDSPPVSDDIDRRDAIDRALSGLPAKERAAVRLYWLDGMTKKQAAAVLDLSESRVSQMTTRTLPRLREHRALAPYAEVA
jgi:RNA polymerase sigma factor for flagellar operon FliA